MNLLKSMFKKLLIPLIGISIVLFLITQKYDDAFAQTNSPPNCSGGITVTGLQKVNDRYILEKGQTYQLVAQGITDPQDNPAQSISTMTFRYKPTNAPQENQCPSPNDGSLLGQGIKTFTGSNLDLVYTFVLDTNVVPSGEYYFFANPIDTGGLQCSGNPYGSTDNNYCGVGVGCTNCYTTILIGVGPSVLPSGIEIPTSTPVPTNDPCPNAIFGNLSCDPDGLIDITDVGIFLEQFFGANLTTSTSKANFSDDGSSIIDTGDYEILRQHYTPGPLPI